MYLSILITNLSLYVCMCACVYRHASRHDRSRSRHRVLPGFLKKEALERGDFANACRTTRIFELGRGLSWSQLGRYRSSASWVSRIRDRERAGRGKVPAGPAGRQSDRAEPAPLDRATVSRRVTTASDSQGTRYVNITHVRYHARVPARVAMSRSFKRRTFSRERERCDLLNILWSVVVPEGNK